MRSRGSWHILGESIYLSVHVLSDIFIDIHSRMTTFHNFACYSSISSSNSKLLRSAVASLVLNIVIILAGMTTPPDNALDLYKDCFSVAQVSVDRV